MTVYNLTQDLLRVVERTVKEDRREVMMEHVVRLMDERESAMMELSPPFTKKEQELGQKIQQMNTVIQEQLQSHLTNVQHDLRKVKRQRTNEKTYASPYETAVDGAFFDHRK
ncbi:hypothetical protein EV213_11535 [Aureibacillus halotolerans]|uniref:Flagellar protein FliT n=2 Tax=Aureibacillus halotolerans TaxID=1508390 RepID=A0A4R6TW55_9BACI|nr:hypothetical protein EV213_11535 [Aureibacillus halotolerans]